MIIRAINKRDLKSCAALYAQVFASAPWLEPWTIEAAFNRLTYFYESLGFVGVLVEKEDLIGFALGNAEPFHSGDLFYLREMCIAPNNQSQGLGRRVISELENELRSRNLQSIYLTTERDIPAAQFYINNGFNYVKKMGFYAKRLT